MLSRKQSNHVCRLWDELADFDAASSERALVHLMKTACDWIHADNALWIGGVRMMRGAAAKRDAQHGWRGRVVQHWRESPAITRKARLAIQTQDTAPAMTTTAITTHAGIFRAHRLHDGFVNLAKFKRTAHYQAFYEGAGISDRMWIVFPVNADVESYFVFDRYRRGKNFSKADEELAAFALRGVKWFHRQLMLQHGLLVAGTPLTSAEQKIVSLLLTDKSEKEIAEELGRSFHTTHWYVMEIFRKFGVNGRAGLMALWLGKTK
jgi:DNA-binding CsgD family transcriptional regulator